VVLKRTFHPEGINMGLNLGAAAGAGVKDHLHFHVVPRWAGDTNFMPVVADVRVIPQSLDHAHEILKKGFEDLCLERGAS
jgi:ATP adenylyltransferase